MSEGRQISVATRVGELLAKVTHGTPHLENAIQIYLGDYPVCDLVVDSDGGMFISVHVKSDSDNYDSSVGLDFDMSCFPLKTIKEKKECLRK